MRLTTETIKRLIARGSSSISFQPAASCTVSIESFDYGQGPHPPCPAVSRGASENLISGSRFLIQSYWFVQPALNRGVGSPHGLSPMKDAISRVSAAECLEALLELQRSLQPLPMVTTRLREGPKQPLTVPNGAQIIFLRNPPRLRLPTPLGRAPPTRGSELGNELPWGPWDITWCPRDIMSILNTMYGMLPGYLPYIAPCMVRFKYNVW